MDRKAVPPDGPHHWPPRRARHNLDRHANHIVAAYLTGGA